MDWNSKFVLVLVLWSEDPYSLFFSDLHLVKVWCRLATLLWDDKGHFFITIMLKINHIKLIGYHCLICTELVSRGRPIKIERLSTTFIFLANGKNSTSADCRLALVRGNEKFCVCRECGIFSLILWGIDFRIRKKWKTSSRLPFAA